MTSEPHTCAGCGHYPSVHPCHGWRRDGRQPWRIPFTGVYVLIIRRCRCTQATIGAQQ